MRNLPRPDPRSVRFPDPRTAATGARRQRGSTLLGFMGGMVLALVIAVGIAVYVTKAHVPFMNRTARPTDRPPIEAPRNPAEAPDPNKPLYSRSRGGNGAGDTAVAGTSPTAPPPAIPSQPSPQGQAPSAIPGQVAGVIQPAPTNTAAVKPSAGGVPIEQRTVPGMPDQPAPGDRSTYFLQAGSFSQQPEAEAMRARLALVGYEARVQPADINGQRVYRVRIGPFGEFDDMNNARSKLAEAGMNSSVIRQR